MQTTHSAEPEAEIQTTVHSSQVAVVRVEADLRAFDQLNEEVVADQAAVLMQGTFVSGSKMLNFEGVIVKKVATAEVIEEASAIEIFVGQLEQLVA